MYSDDDPRRLEPGMAGVLEVSPTEIRKSELFEQRYSMTSVNYVEARLEDVGRITKFHQFTDPNLFVHEYFTYLSDKSVFFIAQDGEEVIGTQAFVPHHMTVGGHVMLTGRSERTLVSPNYRGQNVFGNLMEHCCRQGSEKGMQFFWGAGTGATKAFARSGFLHITGHRQYLIAATGITQVVKTLFAPETRAILSPSALRETLRGRDRERLIEYVRLGISPVSLLVRSGASLLTQKVGGVELLTAPRTDEDINALYQSLPGQNQVMRLTHSSPFHDWIYDGANTRVQWLFAYRHNELLGYLTMSMDEPDVLGVMDFAARDKVVFRLLLEEARRIGCTTGKAFMLAVCNPRNPQQKALYPSFYAQGFIPTMTGGNSVIRAGVFNDMSFLANSGAWYITDAWFTLYRNATRKP